MKFTSITLKTQGYFLSVIAILLSQATLAQPVFFTPTGAGTQNGSSWANAYPASQFTTVASTVSTSGTPRPMYLAEGTYTITAVVPLACTSNTTGQITNFYLKGGFPVGAMGTDTSQYAPADYISIIQPVSSNINFYGYIAPSSTANIKILGVELKNFSNLSETLGTTASFSPKVPVAGGGSAILISGATRTNSTSNANIELLHLNVHDNNQSAGGSEFHVGGLGGATVSSGGTIAIASLASSSSIVIQNSYFGNNTSINGGAIFLYRTPFTVTGCSFVMNKTSPTNINRPGGAIDIEHSNVASSSVINNTFCQNGLHNAAHQGTEGGAIFSWTSGNILIQDNNFFGNKGIDVGVTIGVSAPTSTNTIDNNGFYSPDAFSVAYSEEVNSSTGSTVLTNNNFEVGPGDAYNGQYSNNPATSNQFNQTNPNPGLTCATYSDLVPDIPLPITWLSFNAEKKGAAIQVNWSVANEQNVMGYFVERSSNGSQFREIAEMEATCNGCGEQKITYLITDKQPLSGKNFYRIKQVDMDWQYTYSNTRLVYFNEAFDNVNIGPNPAKNHFSIMDLNATKTYTFLLLNAMGQVMIKQQCMNTTTHQLEVHQLTSGHYHLQVECEGERHNYPIQIVK